MASGFDLSPHIGEAMAGLLHLGRKKNCQASRLQFGDARMTPSIFIDSTEADTVQMEDEKLIAQFLEGEAEAVGRVEEWIARAAWPFQRRLAAQWDDVLQDAQLEVTNLLRQNKFRGQSGLRTYLARVVSNTCIDYIRAQSKWNWTELENLPEPAGRAADSPLAQLLRKEADDLLLRVLAEMPEECREALGMIVDGMSYREMSRRLGVLEGALRVRVLRCRQKATALRERLAGEKSKIPA
jgi:RNA polymerase sigma factor (sigma-70 family)